MPGSTEQLTYEPAPAAVDPVGRPNSDSELTMAVPSATGITIDHSQPVKTWRTAQVAGNEAYTLARQHEHEHGLDEEAAYMYEEATRELIGVTWRGPETMLAHPINELRIASLSKPRPSKKGFSLAIVSTKKQSYRPPPARLCGTVFMH